ncbi:cardiolipin synthase ClsB [Limnohabitans radicicola]|uniref:Cardiolipin synthase B n=1 Tax=Limnohabitans radicicola TaxID=2771427 RepID=A0A927IKP1_9BURK|nr:cardiolipin synthase ClsB [Limnohabitans radicicola]MBD8049356.1 cardiolipin synthase ClsB [Limnohabitans radicicola]
MRHTAPLRDGHQIRLIDGGEAYFQAVITAVDRARSQVQLETYIFDFHGAAAAVAEALERAALRGVRVWLVVDGVGTGRLPAEWALRFERAGVSCRVYSPLGALGLLIPSRWRRLHRKLCVVDGQQAFCGGINILDDWYDPHHGTLSHPRLDFAVQARGALVQQVQETMTQLWWRLQAVRHVRQHNFPEAFSSFRAAGLHLPWTHEDGTAEPDQIKARAGLLLRDNVRHRSQIERAYLKAIGMARREIVIANAYFLPGRRVRAALIHAARRGVRVRLLLQGRYEYFMQYHAVRPVYGALLASGVEIHEYTASFLHAKVAVIDPDSDRPWATVGSSNLDPLSLLLAREANVVVADRTFAVQLHRRLVQAMEEQSTPIDAATYLSRPWHQRLRDRIAFGLMRLMLFISGLRY